MFNVSVLPCNMLYVSMGLYHKTFYGQNKFHNVLS
jgi:hypothetical protein